MDIKELALKVAGMDELMGPRDTFAFTKERMADFATRLIAAYCEKQTQRIATLEQQNAELERVAEGIEHRKRLRGFYVPEDTTDLLEALSKVKQP